MKLISAKSRARREARATYLPDEILLQIVSHIARDDDDDDDDDDDARRQATLYTCCLISRQWYSVAVPFLYERPQLATGTAFQKFTATVCPPVGVRGSKMKLGSLVRRLDLSPLVHHSSNSLTARLLGRVKENLEVFIAPMISFSTNCLPALSKCGNLRHLDLSLVRDHIPFANLKKAIGHLQRLTSLRLPRSTILTVDDDPSSLLSWPPGLSRLQLSGSFPPSSLSSIGTLSWPASLTSLTLKNCTDLSVGPISALLSSPQLARSLIRLRISNANRALQPESINAVPAFLPGLKFLSVPGDLVQEPFFDLLRSVHRAPLALEVLELDAPYSESAPDFATETLLDALRTGLANLRAIGFHEAYCTDERIAEDEDVDDALKERAAKRRSEVLGADEEEEQDAEEEMVGVYYLAD
ncbi:hypothetical protein VTN02DRAFT_4990 [Thermoascus thermophilus]